MKHFCHGVIQAHLEINVCGPDRAFDSQCLGHRRRMTKERGDDLQSLPGVRVVVLGVYA